MNVKEDMLKKKKEINEKTEIFFFDGLGVGEMIRLSGIKCGEFPMHIIRLYLIWCLHYL